VNSGRDIFPSASPTRPAGTDGRNWLPLVLAAAVVLVAAAVVILVLEHGKGATR
jgi:hypothetical protein